MGFKKDRHLIVCKRISILQLCDGKKHSQFAKSNILKYFMAFESSLSSLEHMVVSQIFKKFKSVTTKFYNFKIDFEDVY